MPVTHQPRRLQRFSNSLLFKGSACNAVDDVLRIATHSVTYWEADAFRFTINRIAFAQQNIADTITRPILDDITSMIQLYRDIRSITRSTVWPEERERMLPTLAFLKKLAAESIESSGCLRRAT